MLAVRCDVRGFDTLGKAIAEAVAMSYRLDVPVVFDFNGVDVLCLPGETDDQVDARYRARLASDRDIKAHIAGGRRWWKFWED